MVHCTLDVHNASWGGMNIKLERTERVRERGGKRKEREDGRRRKVCCTAHWIFTMHLVGE